MGRTYKQLSLEERCSIAELHRAGRSIRQIAAALDREPSTIGRELKRNSSAGPRAAPYQPAYAQQQTAARRWSGSRLERDDVLRDRVLGDLEMPVLRLAFPKAIRREGNRITAPASHGHIALAEAAAPA